MTPFWSIAWPPITGKRGIHFGTVAPPNMGQHPTFDPESSILWDLGMLTVVPGAWRPATVPKWIPLSGNMLGSRGAHRRETHVTNRAGHAVASRLRLKSDWPRSE